MSHSLAERVRRGLEALRQGRPEEAVEALEPVVADPDLEAAADLTDVRARVCSLLAQALLETGRPAEARRVADQALAAARAVGDEAGALEIGALQRRAVAAWTEDLRSQGRARERGRLAARPLSELLQGVETPLARAQVLIEKANADLDVDAGTSAVDLAEEALALAKQCGSAREEVLAWLTVARAAPERADEAVHAAWKAADDANDFNLVGAVARAARMSGVTLPAVVGPQRDVS